MYASTKWKQMVGLGGQVICFYFLFVVTMTTKKEYYDFCKREKEKLAKDTTLSLTQLLYKLIDSIYDHYIDKAETPDFDAFRSKYPIKKWKTKAKSKYLSIVKSWVSHETIMQWLQNYLKHIYSEARTAEYTKYIKHPLTWLNGWCREDEYEVRLTTFVKKKVRVPEEKKEVTDPNWAREALKKARESILSKSM